MENKITIEYCIPCRFEKQANQLAEEIKAQFGSQISQVELIPTKLIGSFEITLGDDLIYSKKNSGRLPHPGEIEQILMMRLIK